jgi:hypothetical protein
LLKNEEAAAAALFMVDELEVDYLSEIGVDVNDLAGSFERLCESQTILGNRGLFIYRRIEYGIETLLRRDRLSGTMVSTLHHI